MEIEKGSDFVERGEVGLALYDQFDDPRFVDLQPILALRHPLQQLQAVGRGDGGREDTAFQQKGKMQFALLSEGKGLEVLPDRQHFFRVFKVMTHFDEGIHHDVITRFTDRLVDAQRAVAHFGIIRIRFVLDKHRFEDLGGHDVAQFLFGPTPCSGHLVLASGREKRQIAP